MMNHYLTRYGIKSLVSYTDSGLVRLSMINGHTYLFWLTSTDWRELNAKVKERLSREKREEELPL